jgi:hypothetical protein
MKRRNSGRPDREVHVSLETSRAGDQCLSDSYEGSVSFRGKTQDVGRARCSRQQQFSFSVSRRFLDGVMERRLG